MSSDSQSSGAHKLALAEELVDDIELGRLPPENLLLKAARLARFISDERTSTWINYELMGYVSDDPISLKWMGATGRYTDREKGIGYWSPFAQIEAYTAVNQTQMQQLRVPDVHFAPSSSNPHELVTGVGGFTAARATAPVQQVIGQLNQLNTAVSQLSGVRSRVLALLHTFASKVYYELSFGNTQESLFEKQRVLIDAELASACGEVLRKVPAVYERLREGDAESISQALTTCRRIADAFADSIYPPSMETVTIGENVLKLTAIHHQNRINAFVHHHCASVSRRKRIRRMLEDIYDRLGTGIHQDVTAEEARFLFLQTYLLIGEILVLKRIPERAHGPAA